MSNSIKDLLDYNIVKKCNKCDTVQIITNFYFRKDTNKYINSCKSCKYEMDKRNKANKKEEIAVYQKNYRQLNKEQLSLKKKEYDERNKDIIRKRNQEYRKNNRDKINSYFRNKRKNDINFRLIDNTRRRINSALNGNSKSFHSQEILGIDIETYKRWIEFQMTEEMNFDNIHIDHVKPISSFDVSKEEEFLEAFNWRNTQPLLKEDNLKKSNKFNELDYRLQFIKAYEFLKLNDKTDSD